ncbi:MAG: acyl-CoA dehydrogenase family protein [Myxococcota bacterium]|nr:acyl-CoA dehydrogenase family protein [Myxococcota bacterium]
MDFTMDPSFEKLRQMVAWLGRDKLRPLGMEADALGHALPPEHPFFTEVLELGLTGGFAGKMGKPRTDDDGRPRRTVRRAVVMAEEAAYWDRGMATCLPGPGLGGAPVMLMGNADQKARFLHPFKDRTRPRWAAFGMTEPGAGSDVASIRTRIREDGDELVLDGQKCFISNGARAAFTVVWGTVDPAQGRAGHRAVVVERDTPGFTVAGVEHKMGLHASETATLLFESCRVPRENLLTSPQDKAGEGGFKGAMKTFNMTRPMVAAMAVGIARAAYDEASRFAREAFTGPSAWRRDRVADRLAHIRRKIEMSRLLAWKAGWQADHHQPNELAASMAKAAAAPLALEAASLGLEILGETGLGSDALLEKLYRDVKALDIVEGTGQIQRIVIARRLLGHTTNPKPLNSQGESRA